MFFSSDQLKFSHIYYTDLQAMKQQAICKTIKI